MALLIHGTYHFGKKRVACRNDYCSTCLQARFAEGWRSFVVLHLYFIPILPIARIVRWFCTTCGNETNKNLPSRKGILILGAVFGYPLAIAGGLLILLKVEDASEVGLIFIIVGSVLGFGSSLVMWIQGRSKSAIKRPPVTPLNMDRCPYCERELLPSVPPKCHDCNVKITTLPGRD